MKGYTLKMSNVKAADRKPAKSYYVGLANDLYRELFNIINYGRHVPKHQRRLYDESLLIPFLKIVNNINEANSIYIKEFDDYKRRRKCLKKAYNKIFSFGTLFNLLFNRSCTTSLSGERFSKFLNNLYVLAKCIEGVLKSDVDNHKDYAIQFKEIKFKKIPDIPEHEIYDNKTKSYIKYTEKKSIETVN